MERRVLVAVFLSFLVLYAYQALLIPPPPAPHLQSPTDAQEVNPNRQLTPQADDQLSPITSPALSPGRLAAIPPADPDPVVGDTQARDIVVESAAFRAVFSNRGAVLVSWALKDYLEEGRPVDLVPRDLPPDEPWPFSVTFKDEGITALTDAALFRPSVTNLG